MTQPATEQLCVHCQWRLVKRDLRRGRCPECGRAIARTPRNAEAFIHPGRLALRDVSSRFAFATAWIAFIAGWAEIQAGPTAYRELNTDYGPTVVGFVLVHAPAFVWLIATLRFRSIMSAARGWLREWLIYQVVVGLLIACCLASATCVCVGAYCTGDSLDRHLRFELGFLITLIAGAAVAVTIWFPIARAVLRWANTRIRRLG